MSVHDGMIIKNSVNYFNLCGKNIEDIIIDELIKKKNIIWDNWNILQKIQILSDIKDMIFTPDDNNNTNYILPDKTSIEINNEFVSYMKKEIENKLFNEEKSLKSLILKSISSVLLDIKKELINNIFICGGNSLIFNNYFNNLKDSLSKQLVSGTLVKLTSHPSKIERSLTSFLGASIVSSLNIYKESIVKKEEYEEHGSNIIEKKCA